MKSFFKKLAFVMALAMVVSMVAPAGSALAATTGVSLQGTKTIVETYELEKDATVDLAFEGCTTWKEYKNTDKWGWTSSNTAVATVDKAGLVKAVAAGTATITITVGDDYKESVVVTVKGEEVADMAVVQLTEKTSKLVFNKKVDFKKEDAQLYRVFATDVDAVEVAWPIDTWKVADDGMSITFAPFVEYADGDKYIIKVGSYTKEFTTAIGEVTHVFTTFKTGNVADVAYVTPEDADDDVVTTLGVKIMSGTVDVTNVYANKFDISYEFFQDAEYANANLDEDDGEITFSEKGAVTVTAVVSYEDEEGEDQTLANVMPATITPADIPDYEVVKVVDWAVVHKDHASWQFSWDNKSLYAGDEDYKIVLKLQDNRGNTLVTDARALKDKLIWTGNDSYEFDKEGYEVEFYSTNTDDFLVDTDGSIATYKKTDAVIYVKLFADNEEGEKTFLKNIYAFELKVDKAREITNVIFGEGQSKVDMPVDALADNKHWELLTSYLWIGAFDQSWTDWGKLPLVKDGTLESADFEVVATSPAEAMDLEGTGWNLQVKADSTATLVVNSDVLYQELGKTKVTFTVKELVSEKKITTTINLKKPTRVADADLKDENGKYKETRYTHLEGTEWVKNFNVLPAKEEGMYIVLDLSKNQFEVAVNAADKNLGYDKDKDSVYNVSKSAVVNFYQLSNDYKVGFYFEGFATLVEDKDWADVTTGIEVGDKFMAVINPKGDYLYDEIVWECTGEPWYASYDNGNSKPTQNLLVNLLSQKADGELEYAEAGKYTVYVYTVNKVTIDEKTKEITDIDYVERKDTFTVSYGQAAVKCADRIAITTKRDFGTKDAPNEANIAKIIVESFAWTLDGKAWDIDEASDLVDMANTTYTIKGDNIIIRKVTFKVPYDGGNSLVAEKDTNAKEAFYTKKVDVNMAVEYVTE